MTLRSLKITLSISRHSTNVNIHPFWVRANARFLDTDNDLSKWTRVYVTIFHRFWFNIGINVEKFVFRRIWRGKWRKWLVSMKCWASLVVYVAQFAFIACKHVRILFFQMTSSVTILYPWNWIFLGPPIQNKIDALKVLPCKQWESEHNISI